jgi:hypothetical protein
VAVVALAHHCTCSLRPLQLFSSTSSSLGFVGLGVANSPAKPALRYVSQNPPTHGDQRTCSVHRTWLSYHPLTRLWRSLENLRNRYSPSSLSPTDYAAKPGIIQDLEFAKTSGRDWSLVNTQLTYHILFPHRVKPPPGSGIFNRQVDGPRLWVV